MPMKARITFLKRPLFYLLVAWLLPAAIGLGYLCYVAGTNRIGLLMHLAVLFAVLLLCLLPFTFPFFLRPPLNPKRLLLAFPLATFHCISLVFCVASVSCYLAFRATPTWELIDVYLGQFSLLIAQFQVPIVASLAVIAATWLALIGTYFALAPSLQSAVGAAPGSASSRKRWRIGMILSLALLALVYVSNWRSWLIREPIHAMWLVKTQMNAMMPDGFRAGHSVLYDARLAALPNLKPATPRNLIFITVDALRSDQMELYGAPYEDTPYLTSLYRAGKIQRIDSAYSVCTFSFCGMLGAQSSAYWRQLDGSSLVIADVLHHYGYKTRFLLSGDHTHFFGLSRWSAPISMNSTMAPLSLPGIPTTIASSFPG